MKQIKKFFPARVFLTAMLFASGLYGETKVYNKSSAIVNYTISGKSEVSKESNITIKGNSTLVFDQWGLRKVYKEVLMEKRSGVVRGNKKTIQFIKEENGIVSEVDFARKTIKQSDNPVVLQAIKNRTNIFDAKTDSRKEKGTLLGRDSVLGYDCVVWLYKGKKSCLYEGIVLKEESLLSNIPYLKIATSAEFDKNISDDLFAMPEFQEQEQQGYLLKENKDSHTHNIQQAKNIQENNDAVDGGEVVLIENTLKSDPTQELFVEQKELLLGLLAFMQESRICLENVTNSFTANDCIANLNDLKEKIYGTIDENSTIENWSAINREKYLDHLENEMLELKRRLPCIRKSVDLDSLIQCVKEAQKE